MHVLCCTAMNRGVSRDTKLAEVYFEYAEAMLLVAIPVGGRSSDQCAKLEAEAVVTIISSC